ncbi:hypothetical protein J6590_045116 [Homalodisca vitripennis]|nr:hypothetical protein J6590_045116 [Homalodisca vitripennis]
MMERFGRGVVMSWRENNIKNEEQGGEEEVEEGFEKRRSGVPVLVSCAGKKSFRPHFIQQPHINGTHYLSTKLTAHIIHLPHITSHIIHLTLIMHTSSIYHTSAERIIYLPYIMAHMIHLTLIMAHIIHLPHINGKHDPFTIHDGTHQPSAIHHGIRKRTTSSVTV